MDSETRAQQTMDCSHQFDNSREDRLSRSLISGFLVKLLGRPRVKYGREIGRRGVPSGRENVPKSDADPDCFPLSTKCEVNVKNSLGAFGKARIYSRLCRSTRQT